MPNCCQALQSYKITNMNVTRDTDLLRNDATFS